MVYNEFISEYEKRVKQVNNYLDKIGISIYVANNIHYDFHKDTIDVYFDYKNKEYKEEISVKLLRKSTVVVEKKSSDNISDSTFLGQLDFESLVLSRMRSHNIHTVKDLKELGYDGICKLPRMTEERIQSILDTCQKYGIELTEGGIK